MYCTFVIVLAGIGHEIYDCKTRNVTLQEIQRLISKFTFLEIKFALCEVTEVRRGYSTSARFSKIAFCVKLVSQTER